MENKAISINADGGQVVATLSGSLTVPNIGGIKSELDKVIGKAKSLKMEATEVDDVDLSFVQLVLSLKAYCKTKGIVFETKFEFPAESQRLLDKAGLKMN